MNAIACHRPAPFYLGWLFAVWFGGCHRNAQIPLPPPTQLDQPWSIRTPGDYRLCAGDELDIKFFYQPTLNESVVIRPDGKISLQLVGDLQAAGKTPEELRLVLKEKYTQHIQVPEVAVILKVFQKMRVFIGGEVKIPQMLPLQNPLTALQAIFQAGGFMDTADPDKTLLVRDTGDGKPKIFQLNLGKMLRGEGQEGLLFLHPSDIVFVPRSTIADVNLALRQYLYNNLPIQFAMGLSYGVYVPQ